MPSKLLIVCLLLQAALECLGQSTQTNGAFSIRNSRLDGWYNNLDHPEWGTAGAGMTRKAPARYEDGIQVPDQNGMPNAKTVSEKLLHGETGIPSKTGHSVFFAFFGKLLSDDIVDTKAATCPNEYINIRFKKNGSSTEEVLPMYRGKYLTRTGSSTNAPRIMMNQVTAWLDGSVIYGASGSWTEHLRLFESGRLLEEKMGFPPFNHNEIPLYNPAIHTAGTNTLVKRNPAKLLSFGNRRGNENPFLISMEIIWFRWHNYWAEYFEDRNPNWPDQKVFDVARKWTVATLQKIAMYDWLPEITGMHLPPYNKSGHNPHLNPGISVEFAMAAMRVGHSLVPSGVVLRHSNCTPLIPLPSDYGASQGEPALRLCNTYFQLQDAIVTRGIDNIVMGMMSQAVEAADRFVVEDLAEFTYGPPKRTRMDLEAMTIQRGRDAGLPSYNEARKAYGLSPVKSFRDINRNLSSEVISRVAELYGDDISRLDMYVGGMLESGTHLTGELFTSIIFDQFQRTRDSDRFWFENTRNKLFTLDEVNRIRNLTMRDVIAETTSIFRSAMQENVFRIEGSKCPPIPVTPSNFTKPCTPNSGIDYFHGQWGKYVGVLVLLLLFPTIAYFVMCAIAWKRQRDAVRMKKQAMDRAAQKSSIKRSTRRHNGPGNEAKTVYPAFEIEGKEKARRILVALEGPCIVLLSMSSAELRRVCFSPFKRSFIFISRNKNRDIMVIRVPKEYDIVLRFATTAERENVLKKVQVFMKTNSIQAEVFEMDESALQEEAVTKEMRQSLVESFFREAFAQVLELESTSKKLDKRDRTRTMSIADCELTPNELAESLGMKANSLFVQQMFRLADKDKSGYLSFREVADLVVLLMNGSPEQKAQMIFEMYDLDHSGELNREEGSNMIRSFLEMAGAKLGSEEVDAAVEAIFREAGVGEGKDCLTLQDFTYAMLKEHRDAFENAQLSVPGCSEPRKSIDRTALSSFHNSNIGSPGIRRRIMEKDKEGENGHAAYNGSGQVFSEAVVAREERTWWGRWWRTTKRNIENYRRHIFCMVVFYGVTIALMVERATFYAFGAEHNGIRRVTEWGIIISRSTAAAMSFHFSFILLTMCRNLITFCRETFLKNLIPFDASVAFHKQIAYVALVETLLHVFGHLVNVYHFSVHPMPVLACLFPKLFVDDGSDIPKTATWWVFQTIPGTTGVLLLLVISIMYVFAIQFSRRFCFRAFFITHHLYAVLYCLTILHGSMAIVQKPVFHFYLVVPLVIFFIDKMIIISRSKVEIKVVKVELLPSGVTNLVFKRPTAFDYRSGQWVRIASLALGSNEYHPFTLTSAPHERHLSLHVRAAGPWTTNLRNLYQSAIEQGDQLPNLYLDGPFGEGHQDWYKYDISVLVGAGIGVTPFASILKDIVNKTNTQKGFQITCKKVYFVWVTRTQRHFEWLTDIIRDLEESDGENLVSTHIYITQFANKFDLRTTMLYICERYFQKVANKSMFTGLKAMTHFGRPQFEPFLNSLQTMHSDVRTIGVFSCGPPGLTNGVEDACRRVNRLNKARFNHFYENF